MKRLFLYGVLLLLFLRCDEDKIPLPDVVKSPAPVLSYSKQIFSFSSISGSVFEKTIIEDKILSGVKGEKDGYRIKYI